MFKFWGNNDHLCIPEGGIFFRSVWTERGNLSFAWLLQTVLNSFLKVATYWFQTKECISIDFYWRKWIDLVSRCAHISFCLSFLAVTCSSILRGGEQINVGVYISLAYESAGDLNFPSLVSRMYSLNNRMKKRWFWDGRAVSQLFNIYYLCFLISHTYRSY